MVSEWFHWFQGGFHWFLVGFIGFLLVSFGYWLASLASIGFRLVSDWFLVKLTRVRNFAECTYGPRARGCTLISPRQFLYYVPQKGLQPSLWRERSLVHPTRPLHHPFGSIQLGQTLSVVLRSLLYLQVLHNLDP